jgi:hypothetical protein
MPQRSDFARGFYLALGAIAAFVLADLVLGSLVLIGLRLAGASL